MKRYNVSNLFLILIAIFFSCDNSEVINYKNIVGLYSCDENSPTFIYRKYIVEIQEVAAQENTFIMANFHNLGDNEFLYIKHIGDSVYIENQIIQQYFVDGKGYVNDDYTEMHLTYTTSDGTQELEYSTTLTR